MMKIFNFKVINRYVIFVGGIVGVIVGLSQIIPNALASMQPINEQQVERLLNEHHSFVQDGNLEAMSTVYHPDFSMGVIHSSGHRESFDKSQILKHVDGINRSFNLTLDEKSRQIAILDDKRALVSITFVQGTSLDGLPVRFNEQLYQSALVIKDNGEIKILKVLSIAIKI